MSLISIGKAANELGVSTHTLRYYEKIGLSTNIVKDSGGRRRYSQKDMDRLKFIKRAQRMHFSLEEIKALLDIERETSVNKSEAQGMVREKLEQIEGNLSELNQLKTDLSTLLNACIKSGESEDCPIIDGLKSSEKS